MVKLVSTKNHRYNTRALRAGDVFEASPRDAKILRGLKKAELAPEVAPTPPPAPEVSPPPAEQGVERSDIYRMRKADLIEFLTSRGFGGSEDETRDELLTRALSLL